MGTYRHTATADLPADDVFAYLRDPRNLPRFFPQMTEAEPTGGGEAHVEADVGGKHVEGEAWLRADEARRRLEWGADDDDYHGELEVAESSPGSCEITVVLHTERAEGGEIQRALEETVAALTHTAVAETDVDGARGDTGAGGVG
ncbi:SRPBCC family protein [Amycolatopsis sp. CA-230715]|uniref:SRPBCC family protein n=1 Tax=Amycolatopsis sp. CA-230715 TaxID=2745196 RepID=UPI001C035CF7|nr:SRPBCC family protein [Amycolatopsis sp. CA-230715]